MLHENPQPSTSLLFIEIHNESCSRSQLKMKFDRSRKRRAREPWSWLPAVEIGGTVETVRTDERKSTGLSGIRNIGSKWQSARKRNRSRKKRKRRKETATRWNLRAKCIPCEYSGRRQRATSVRLAVSFVFIILFRSLDSTLFLLLLVVFLFLCLFYLIISRRCAIVPQFVYLVAYLAACLFVLPQPVEPIYTKAREFFYGKLNALQNYSYVTLRRARCKTTQLIWKKTKGKTKLRRHDIHAIFTRSIDWQ